MTRSEKDDHEDNNFQAKNAGKLRKKLHINCAQGDLKETRRILKQLYDSPDSPLEHAENTPEKFSAIVEATALALCSSNEDLGKEMIKNVEHLHQAFKVSEEENSKLLNALREFATNVKDLQMSFVDAHADFVTNLENKTSFRNIKLMRYLDKFPSEFRASGPPEH